MQAELVLSIEKGDILCLKTGDKKGFVLYLKALLHSQAIQYALTEIPAIDLCPFVCGFYSAFLSIFQVETKLSKTVVSVRGATTAPHRYSFNE